MQPSRARAILLDIEGTTSSISFVYDIMFPYFRQNLRGFLANAWSDAAVQECLQVVARDLRHDTLESWLGQDSVGNQQAIVVDGVIGLVDQDVKATGLKQLQGLVWKEGFHSRQMVAHLFDDVADSIRQWNRSGIDVRIYSSGSIQAQRLFFGHSMAGDLLDQFGGHYDTTTGPKKEPDSYRKIAVDFALAPNEILFVSDVVAELDAARVAGMEAVLCVRPGNHPVEHGHSFDTIESFSEIVLEPEQNQSRSASG